MTPPATPEALHWIEEPMHAAHLGAAASCAGLARTHRALGLDDLARLWTLTADWHRAQAEAWTRLTKGSRP